MNKNEIVRNKLIDYQFKALKRIAKELGSRGYSKIRSKEKLIDFLIENNEINRLASHVQIQFKKENQGIVNLILAYKLHLIVPVIAGILASIVHSDTIIGWLTSIETESSYQEEGFKWENSEGLKVGVLPFAEVCEYQNKSFDVGYVISERLRSIIDLDSINGEVYYFEEFEVDKNYDFQEARSFLKDHELDQLIFGSYISEDCSKDNEFCINYITSDSLRVPIASSSIEHNSWESSTLRDLREGSMQEELDIIIYWLAALNMYTYDQTRHKTIEFLNKLEYEYGFVTVDVLNLRGNSYFLEQMDTSAFIDFTRSLEIGPRFGDILYQRGSILAQTFNDLDGAIKDYSESLKISPDSGFVYYLRGQLYFELDSIDRAIHDMSRALEISPDNTDPYYYLAAAHQKKREPLVAKRFAEECIKAGESDMIGHCHFVLGQIMFNFRLGTRDSARINFDKGLALQPELEPSYKYYMLRMSGKTMDEATEMLKKGGEEVNIDYIGE